jgi:DNA-binding cell septation regulator SpoVG
LIGFASCIVDKRFFVGNIAIHTTLNGDCRLVFPAKILPNGKQINCFHPITKEAGIAIKEAIINEYERLTKIYYEEKMTKEGIENENNA